eukprot:UN03145
MLAEDELRDAVLLVLANKQDLPNALSVSDVYKQIRIEPNPKSTVVHTSHLRHYWRWSL